MDALLTNDEAMRKYFEIDLKNELSERIWGFFEEYNNSDIDKDLTQLSRKDYFSINFAYGINFTILPFKRNLRFWL